MNDAQRLDCLERWANQKGGVHLHDGSHTGCTGIGLRPGSLVRTLREAVDQIAESERVMAAASLATTSPGSARGEP